MMTEGIQIPLFPLNIFLLPGEQLPLHIFEQRYRQLFREAKSNHSTFGLPFTIESKNIALVSECRLIEVTKEYDSGELDVIIEAIKIGELSQFESIFPGKLYPGGSITYREELELEDDASEELIECFNEFVLLKHKSENSRTQMSHLRMVDVAASVALSSEDKVKLLLTKGHKKREKVLMGTLRYLNLLHRQENSIENGLILN